jgi:ComEC/Rec2-related protein
VIRRRLTPAVALFCSLAAVILLGRAAEREAPGRPLQSRVSFAAAACLTLLCAATGTVLAAAPAGPRRAGIMLLALSLGVAAGSFSLLRMESARDRAWLPVPGSLVSSFSAVLLRDSTLSRDGDTILRVRLTSAASSARGVAAPARGEALVLLQGARRFALGEKVAVRASLDPLAGDGPESWIARVKADRIASQGFASRFAMLRAQARARASRALALAGYPASGLLEALVTGSREDVPPSLSEAFRRTGTLHVLALSGLHVGIVYGLVVWILGFLRRRALRVAAACVVLAAYQVFAGFMPSLERATIMIFAGSLAALLDRDPEPLNLLALSGIVVLGLDPFQAFSVSFQLADLALAGILVLGPLVGRPLQGRVPPALLAPLGASVGAQLATLPVVLPAFGAWYPSGIIAALLLVPLVSVFLALGLGWLILSPLLTLLPGSAVQDLCAAGFGLLYRLIEGCAAALAELPGFTVSPPFAGAWAAAGGALALAAAILLPRRIPWRAR